MIYMHIFTREAINKSWTLRLMQTTQAEQEYTGTTLEFFFFFFFSVLVIRRIRSGKGNESFSNNPASKNRPTYLPH